ncbi:BppU family phage baseplate upper protein, partial [Staphylococcus auricularis]
NLDNHTAVLRFYITKDNHPLLISDKNANTYVYLESKNGSNQIVEDIAYINPMKGLVEITIPIEFLQAS